VVATARPEELDLDHPVHDLLTGLRSLERVAEVEVGRLSGQEAAALAERLLGRPLADPDRDRLVAETEGNPLFVVEAVRAGWSGRGRPAPITPRVQAVIEARLAQLSRPARDLVGVAATIGREFTTDVLAQAGPARPPSAWRAADVTGHGVKLLAGREDVSWCSADRSSGPWTTPPRCSASSATSLPRRPTSWASPCSRAWPRRVRSWPRSTTAGRCWGWCRCGPATRPTGWPGSRPCGGWPSPPPTTSGPLPYLFLPEATAVGERGNGFELNIVAGWPPSDPGGDRHTGWVRRGWTDLPSRTATTRPTCSA
jgi:hypothetical protein